MGSLIIQSERIVIRHTGISDLEYVLQAEQDDENSPYVGQWSREEHQQSLANPDQLHLLIETVRGKAIGYVIMAGLQNPNGSIEFKRFVITEKGAGFGKETLSLIKAYAFDHLHAHRLWLDVRAKNLRAQHVYLTQGFKQEGVLRECILYQGEYESLVVMSLLEQEYRN